MEKDGVVPIHLKYPTASSTVSEQNQVQSAVNKSIFFLIIITTSSV